MGKTLQEIKSLHRRYLARHDFIIETQIELTKTEKHILRHYGNWMSALSGGAIPAFTEAQRHFCAAVAGDAGPNTEFECAFLKYRDQSASIRQIAEARRTAVIQSEQAQLDEFIENLKCMTDMELFGMFTKNLSLRERAYLEKEWTHRVPATGGIIYATTDGQG
jgi:uncharacterized protein YifE (UPF0438 family)